MTALIIDIADLKACNFFLVNCSADAESMVKINGSEINYFLVLFGLTTKKPRTRELIRGCNGYDFTV
jgi:hypothetical protein